MDRKLKVMTVVGTRPEIIRLSATIKLLDEYTDHVLVHTGQNYDYELNEIFFHDLGLRLPDRFLNADMSSLGRALGSILAKTEQVLLEERPDAFLVLGDTNSCISAVMSKRLKVPVFHMEAGNRSFDENVPEETNRRLIDHVADYNLVYTEHARRNLLAEGIHPSRILLTGSPMNEVLQQDLPAFRGTVPSKLQASLSQGLPVITTVQGDVRALVDDLAIGYTADAESVPSLEQAFRAAAANAGNKRSAMASRARLAYTSRFSQAAGIAAIESILEQASRTRQQREQRTNERAARASA